MVGSSNSRIISAHNRREQFESQLRDLQRDIGNLSDKLKQSGPTSTSLTSSQSARSANGTSALNVSQQSSSQGIAINTSSSTGNSVRFSTGSVARDEAYDALRRDLHQAKRERDDAEYRLSQANQEIAELRKNLLESSRLRATYDHLKQDYDSLKVSLESSERIRKQQKDLINLLQKSHAMSTASLNSSAVIAPRELLSGNMSVNSVSTISHKADATSVASSGVHGLIGDAVNGNSNEHERWLANASYQTSTALGGFKNDFAASKSTDRNSNSDTMRRKKSVSGMSGKSSANSITGTATKGLRSASRSVRSTDKENIDRRSKNINASSVSGSSRSSGRKSVGSRLRSSSVPTRSRAKEEKSEVCSTDAFDYRDVLDQNPSLLGVSSGLSLPEYSVIHDARINAHNHETTSSTGKSDAIPVRHPSYLETPVAGSTLKTQRAGKQHTIGESSSNGKPPRHPSSAMKTKTTVIRTTHRVPQYQPVLETTRRTSHGRSVSTQRQHQTRSMYKAIPTPSSSFTKAQRPNFIQQCHT